MHIIVHVHILIYTTYVHVHALDRVLMLTPTTIENLPGAYTYIRTRTCPWIELVIIGRHQLLLHAYICMYTHPANAYVHVRCRR